MKFSRRNIKILKAACFVAMLVLMVVLNHRIEKVETRHQTKTVNTIAINNSGISPLTAQIPSNPEGTLPIKLISNTNSPFLFFINKGYEFKNTIKFIQNRKLFLNFCCGLQNRFIQKIFSTTKNKDIK